MYVVILQCEVLRPSVILMFGFCFFSYTPLFRYAGTTHHGRDVRQVAYQEIPHVNCSMSSSHKQVIWWCN